MPWFVLIPLVLTELIARCGALAMFYFMHPVVDRNYSHELMSSWSATPMEDRGIDLFRDAVASFPRVQVDGELGIDWIAMKYPRCEPNDADWPSFVRGMERRQRSLELIRHAMDKPVLGIPLRWGSDPTLVVGGTPEDDDGPVSLADRENPPVLAILMPYTGTCRNFARALAADCWLAAGLDTLSTEEKRSRILGDLRAMLGLSRALRESTMAILDLVSIAILSLHDQLLRDLIDAHPAMLDDAALAEIAGRLATLRWPEDLSARIEGETALFEDNIQRTYSLTTSGDGYLCRDGYSMRFIFAGQEPEALLPAQAARLSWAALVRLPTRRQELDAWHSIAEGYATDLRSVPWTRTRLEAGARRDQIAEEWKGSGRSEPLAIVHPNRFASAFASSERARLDRDATLLVIALERFRLANGRWPREQGEIAPFLGEHPPIDPFDGKPLRFVLRDGRPIIYSIGADRKDDGGTPAGDEKANRKAGDWFPPEERDRAPQGDCVLWSAPTMDPPAR